MKELNILLEYYIKKFIIMKRTKKILGILRMASGIGVVLLFVLCALVIGMDMTAVLNVLVSSWPFAAAIFVGYMFFSLGEDFVNNRLSRPHY